MERKYILKMHLYSNETGSFSAQIPKMSLCTDVTLKFRPHPESSVRKTPGNALNPGCEIQKPAAMQQKHRYDLNDLYTMFWSIRVVRIADLRRAVEFYAAFKKGFQIHTYSIKQSGSLRRSVRNQFLRLRKLLNPILGQLCFMDWII